MATFSSKPITNIMAGVMGDDAEQPRPTRCEDGNQVILQPPVNLADDEKVNTINATPAPA